MLCDFFPPKRCLLVGPEERKAMERKMQERRTIPTQMLNTTVSINARLEGMSKSGNLILFSKP